MVKLSSCSSPPPSATASPARGRRGEEFLHAARYEAEDGAVEEAVQRCEELAQHHPVAALQAHARAVDVDGGRGRCE